MYLIQCAGLLSSTYQCCYLDFPLRKSPVGCATSIYNCPENSTRFVGHCVRHCFNSMLSLLISSTSSSAVAFLFLLDSVYYNKPTFTPVNFLRTNLSSVSLFYGADPWHYYITQAIPILCTTGLPFVLHGIWTTLTAPRHNTPSRTMLATILWSIAIYSLGGHKEWRFLHPILPLFHVFAAQSLINICSSNYRGRKVGEKSTYSRASDLRISKRRATLARFDLPDIPAVYLCLIFLTLPASLYVVLFYCDAPVSVLSYFRALPSKELANSTVGFLMPCHSTPGFAYLHRKELTDGGSWALGCEPPLQSVIVIFYFFKKW